MEMVKSLGCSVHLLLWSKHQNKKGLITQERRADPVTVRGRQSPEKLPKLFYSSKQWVCRGGVRHPCVGFPSWRHFPRAWDPLVYFAGTWWGYFLTAPTWKQTRTRLRVCFLFPFLLSALSIKHRALLNLLTIYMAPSVMGCLAQGMCLWPSYFNARSARSCRQQRNFVTCTERTAAFELGFLFWVCTIVCAHLCHIREFLQPCRTIVNAPRHACAALLIPSPKKAL